MKWLIPNDFSWRYTATHGISVLDEDNKEVLKNGSIKYLKEEKVGVSSEVVRVVWEALAAPVSKIYAAMPAILPTSSNPESVGEEKNSHAETTNHSLHYGIDLALGGIGNKNFHSKRIVANDGTHGHLYVHYHAPDDNERGGILFGIEQSAPGMSDQYGGSHDAMASKKTIAHLEAVFFVKMII